MMKLALACNHSLVEEVRTIEKGPDRVRSHEELMGGMYLLVNTLLQEPSDLIGSLNPAGGGDVVPESQDDEFEKGEIKEPFRAEEYDGIYLELGLLLSCEMLDRDASDRAQRMRQRYLVRDDHLFVKRQVGNPRRVVCGRNRQIDVIAALHDGIAGGHRGANATYAKISELYYWDGMMEMVNLHTLPRAISSKAGRATASKVGKGSRGHGRAIRTKTGPVLVSCIEEYYLRYPFVREFVMDRGSEFTCQEVQELLSRTDFAKTTMPRGGREMRPLRRPTGASGGHERHGSYRREHTPEYDDGDIELFFGDYWSYASRRRWTVTRMIERLRGRGRFAEPIARIREEARTWQEVEQAMQRLRHSPVGADGEPIRLQIGNAGEFIPTFERFMHEQAPTPEVEAEPMDVQEEGRERGETPPPPPDLIQSPEVRVETEPEETDWRKEAISTVDMYLAAHAAEHPDLEEVPREKPLQEPHPPPTEAPPEAPPGDIRPIAGRARPRETAEEKRIRVGIRLEEIWQERQRLEASGDLPDRPPDAPAKAPGIPDLWKEFFEQRTEGLTSPTKAGFGVARQAEETLDRRIRFLARTSFDRYLMLGGDLAGKKAKEEGHGPSEAGPSQGPPLGRVILGPEEAKAKREAEKEAFVFRAPTEFATLPVEPLGVPPTSSPLPGEEGPQGATSEPTQGSMEGPMGVLLEALDTMQEEASTPMPELGTETVSEGLPMVVPEGRRESRPQRLDTPEYVPEVGDLRSRLGSWAPESGSGERAPESEQQAVASTMVGSPSSPPPQPKKKKFKRKVDQLFFFCKRGVHWALVRPKFLKDKAEGKVSESAGKMYDRQGRVVERSADGGRAQLYRHNQEEMSLGLALWVMTLNLRNGGAGIETGRRQLRSEAALDDKDRGVESPADYPP
ncbi:hypothetical protein CBR_g52203 [Chara braunii]|uniref:Integrase zinc-binding domain-containing protein n=1 Tax=Chara braunii TaxID=69332 RepID=A0A388M9R5_CHABU|nr:hypothetical protein CBR_g52203 [Chara braunii]|eukprot:GBG91317.1 hypothetical protein CBR_g52203 [Chara braunii]